MPRSGTVPVVSPSCASRLCFNEAGAIMPRSGRGSTVGRRAHAPSFNEAGAIMPRSGQRGPSRHERAPEASMRPGQSCPGVVHVRYGVRGLLP